MVNERWLGREVWKQVCKRLTVTALGGGTLGDFSTFLIISYVRICYDFLQHAGLIKTQLEMISSLEPP